MLFTIGVECPKSENEAFGLVVPALCDGGYACFSAANTEQEIAVMANEAITMMLEVMLDDGASVLDIEDKGMMYYREQEDYSHCDAWLKLDIDLSGL